MARIRTIKPDFWTDDAVAQLSPTAMLLFIGMWNFADDEGYLRDSAGQLRRQIFPDRGWDVESALAELLILGRVQRMDSDQGPLLYVAHMTEHQKIDHPTRSKFTQVRPVGTAIPESSRILANPREPSRPKEGRKEGKEEEGKGSAPRTPPVDNSPVDNPARAVEPPIRCPRHLGTTQPPRCGACKDARIAHEAWERTQARAAHPSRPPAWDPTTHCGHGQLFGTCDACLYEQTHAAEVIHGRFGALA